MSSDLKKHWVEVVGIVICIAAAIIAFVYVGC